jgi:hypothetical protein
MRYRRDVGKLEIHKIRTVSWSEKQYILTTIEPQLKIPLLKGFGLGAIFTLMGRTYRSFLIWSPTH